MLNVHTVAFLMRACALDVALRMQQRLSGWGSANVARPGLEGRCRLRRPAMRRLSLPSDTARDTTQR